MSCAISATLLRMRACDIITCNASPGRHPSFSFVLFFAPGFVTAGCSLYFLLLYPVRQEHVGLMRHFAIAVGGPHQPLPVRSEHREAIKIWVIGHALLPRAVLVDHI